MGPIKKLWTHFTEKKNKKRKCSHPIEGTRIWGAGVHIFTSLCKEKSHSKLNLLRNSKYVNISAGSTVFEEAQESNPSVIIWFSHIVLQAVILDYDQVSS